jgi:hypothetical protein
MSAAEIPNNHLDPLDWGPKTKASNHEKDGNKQNENKAPTRRKVKKRKA